MKTNTIKKIVAIAIPAAAVVACAHAGIKANKVASKKVKEAYTEFETNLNNIETAVKMRKDDPSIDYSMDDAKTDTIATYVIFARKTITAYAPVVGATLAGSAAIGSAYLIRKHVTLSHIMNVLVNHGSDISTGCVSMFMTGTWIIKHYAKAAKNSKDETERKINKGAVIVGTVMATVGAVGFIGINRAITKHAYVTAELCNRKMHWVGNATDILSNTDYFDEPVYNPNSSTSGSRVTKRLASVTRDRVYVVGFAALLDTCLFGWPCVFTNLAASNVSALYKKTSAFTKEQGWFVNKNAIVGFEDIIVGELSNPWAWMTDVSRAKYTWVKF